MPLTVTCAWAVVDKFVLTRCQCDHESHEAQQFLFSRQNLSHRCSGGLMHCKPMGLHRRTVLYDLGSRDCETLSNCRLGIDRMRDYYWGSQLVEDPRLQPAAWGSGWEWRDVSGAVLQCALIPMISTYLSSVLSQIGTARVHISVKTLVICHKSGSRPRMFFLHEHHRVVSVW